jgi:hypothetical protein
MSFREKSAWITLITLIVLSLAFFLHVPRPWTLTPDPTPFMFHVLMLAIGIFVAVEVLAHIVIVIWSPRDARAPKDERERLIELRSTQAAWYVYVLLGFSLMFVALHITGANVIGVAYLMLGSFVIAEIVNYGMRVYLYRRDS